VPHFLFNLFLWPQTLNSECRFLDLRYCDAVASTTPDRARLLGLGWRSVDSDKSTTARTCLRVGRVRAVVKHPAAAHTPPTHTSCSTHWIRTALLLTLAHLTTLHTGRVRAGLSASNDRHTVHCVDGTHHMCGVLPSFSHLSFSPPFLHCLWICSFARWGVL
jgi:hypothetical protein